MNYHIFLQARSDSKRLPFKNFLLFKKIPAILYLCSRLKYLKKNLTVLTTNLKSDAFLRYLLKKNKINFFEGSSSNVKKRFLDFSSKMNDEDIIIRITGDNLLIDSKLIKYCLSVFIKQKKDFLYLDNRKNNLPYGISIEIFKVKKLRNEKSNSKKSQEHVTYGFKNNYNSFTIKKFFKKKVYNYRCTLDYLEDYENLKNLINKKNINIDWKLLCNNLLPYKINFKNEINFKIKKTYELTKTEINKILTLKKTYWKFSLSSQKKFFVKNYKKNDLHFLIFNNSQLIAYNCLKKTKSIHLPFMLIDSFIVTPKYKGKGISNILLAKNINEIINFNKDTYLYANENSLNLYKNFGFKAIKSSKIIEQRPQKKLLKFSL
jgi:spore coat polysaccharide biosynthesis protein SpsF (cytidylyltransferase family)/predicted GNAT family N-acyltransferase